MLDIHSDLKILKNSRYLINPFYIARHGVKSPIGCDLMRSDEMRRVTPRFLFFQLHGLGRAT